MPVQSLNAIEGIIESTLGGLVVLSPANRPAHRRILFVNSYSAWSRIKSGELPSHHLWGCLELVRMGYEIALADPLPDFYFHRNPFPHDLKFLDVVRDWLRPDDIVYCAHNNLYWLPLLKKFGLIRRHVVSLLYAREPLDLSRAHSGIIALNPAAAEQARKLAPKAKVAHLAWGIDLDELPRFPYNPESFLSCGRTQRDHATLSAAAALCSAKIRVINSNPPAGLSWPANVEVTNSELGAKNELSYRDLLHDFYAHAIASLIVVKSDPKQYTACGFTNLLEAMAMGVPVILTRTSALQTEIDVEKEGCGLHVPPDDPKALAEAITRLSEEPALAQAMGERGRRLCETHYNNHRYAAGLHSFFESL